MYFGTQTGIIAQPGRESVACAPPVDRANRQGDSREPFFTHRWYAVCCTDDACTTGIAVWRRASGASALHLRDPQHVIERYRDHAANERTYLAWVRTGITVMVLGFIVEKFEIFLASLHGVLTNKAVDVAPSEGTELVSVALVSLGVLVIVAGAIRFFRVRAQLEAPENIHFRGTTLALVLTVALLAFGIYLLLYLARML